MNYEKTKVAFSRWAEEVYRHLNANAPDSKTENVILDAVHKKIEFIKANAHYGVPIAKKLIPEEYKTRYGTSNLFRAIL